jgi:hypothetical protein
MKTTSLLVLLFYFLCSSAFAAVKEAPLLANQGMFATFGSSRLQVSEVIQNNHFGFMTVDFAKRFGVSKSEMESYNRELDQLNEMMTEVSHELEEMKGPTIDDAISLWSGLKGAVSSTTLEALCKITKGK